MKREISYSIGIIIFVLIAIAMMIVLKSFSSDLTIPWTIAILSFIGAGTVGKASIDSSKNSGSPKVAIIFGAFAVILLICGALVVYTLLI